MEEFTPPKHPRLDFVRYCIRRWTIDLVDDTCRWLWKVIH